MPLYVRNQPTTLDAGTSPVNLNLKETDFNEYDFFGTATLSQNKDITAGIATDVDLFPGSSVPSSLWDGTRIVINWYARITLDGFVFDVLGRELTQREATSDLRITANYVHSLGGWQVQVELIDEDKTYYSVSYTEAAALVAANELKPGSYYIISDTGRPNSDGEIQLRAISVNKFDIKGVHTFAKRPLGAVIYSGGGVGSSIDSITVNGVNILTGVIGWNTDLATTLADAVININANSGVSEITAFSGASTLDIGVIGLYSTTTGNAKNTQDVAGTVTAGVGVLVIDGTSEMEQGLDEYDLWVNIDYDFDNDLILRVSDERGNLYVPASTPDVLYKTAPWGKTNVTGNHFINNSGGVGIGVIGITGSVKNNIFENNYLFICLYSGAMTGNSFSSSANTPVAAILCGCDIINNKHASGSFIIKDLGGADTILDNDISIVDIKMFTTGASLNRNRFTAKSTWADLEITTTTEDKVITPEASNYEGSVGIAANAIDLNLVIGAGIIELTTTTTLDTINNSASIPDELILAPAAANTVTLDSATATNIVLPNAAVPIVLVGATGDYVVLKRSGANWRVVSFHNY